MIPQKQEPKDLGVKIGSKEEALWTTIRDNLKETIVNCEQEAMVQKCFLVVAEKKVKEEEEKRKV